MDKWAEEAEVVDIWEEEEVKEVVIVEWEVKAEEADKTLMAVIKDSKNIMTHH